MQLDDPVAKKQEESAILLLGMWILLSLSVVGLISAIYLLFI